MTYREAACALADRLAETDVTWAVTASANLALRGFDVEPGDLDVMTDAAGIERIAEAFAGDVVRPVRPPAAAENGNIRSYFGALELAGTEVELMGDVEHRVDGRWERADDVASHRELLAVDGRELPAMPLDHERRAYRALGREGRVALLAGGAP
ncbi:MAG: hypothetical protein U5J98_02175 [Halobacteriales archaeon]|nr:hypothetical protein [Halobacteriales archaeon]